MTMLSLPGLFPADDLTWLLRERDPDEPLRVLDGYCCEGGMAAGLASAGFVPYGVDLFRHRDEHGKLVGFHQARYPFASHQGDVLDVLERLLAGQGVWFTHPDGRAELLFLHDFVLLHMSPPCQHASAGTRAMRSRGDDRHPALIEPTRDLLIRTGLPYIIENVKGAALRDPVTLCGCMWNMTAEDEDGVLLHLQRPRLFETSFRLEAPRPCDHTGHVNVAGSYGGGRKWKRPKGCTRTPAELAPLDRYAAKYERHGGYVPRSIAVQQRLLGIDWMTPGGMHQCVPPRYGRHIGEWVRGLMLPTDDTLAG